MKEAKDMLSEEYGRSVRDLFKSFLILIEDLNEDHKNNFKIKIQFTQTVPFSNRASKLFRR